MSYLAPRDSGIHSIIFSKLKEAIIRKKKKKKKRASSYTINSKLFWRFIKARKQGNTGVAPLKEAGSL